jgi:hypothetical protein
MTTGAAFAAALLSPNMAPPAGLIDWLGRPAPRRFDVYRNNVTLGLIRVLQAGFPVTQSLVGEAFFIAMAGEFVRANPPRSRIMMLYGDTFAPFIEGFPPAASLAYLPDVARLEQAIRQSYHARDAAPIDATTLANLDEGALLALRFTFAPAMGVLQSPWPIHAIWAAHMTRGNAPVMQAEGVIILRPNFDPQPHVLPQGSYPVLAALIAGARLGDALTCAPRAFDLGHLLGLLLSGAAITGVDWNAD